MKAQRNFKNIPHIKSVGINHYFTCGGFCSIEKLKLERKGFLSEFIREEKREKEKKIKQ